MELPTNKQIQTFTKRIRDDPIFFVESVLGNTLWEKEKEILISVRDHQVTAVRSCHASGKSYTAARVVNWWLLSHKGSVVITTAPTFRQVKEILWREIRGCITGKGLYPPGAILETAINIDSNWFALGLSSDRADQFQGFHSPHLLVVIDEASGVSQEIYEAIDGLVPEKVLMIGNPLQNTGRFADSFKMVNVSKIHISALDTPNVKEGKEVIPGLITSEYVEKMKQYYGETSDVYRVRVLGEFPLQDTESFIGVDEVSKAMDREITVLPQFELKMGVDPARFGDDRTVMVIRQMQKVLSKETLTSLDTMEITGRVLKTAKDKYIKAENIYVDEIGIGAGVVDRLREQGWKVNGVNVGNKAKDDEHYGNLRAELYAKVKDWLKTGSLPKDDDFYELANMKYKFTSKGQIQMERKEDMKKRGLPSPDVADALMLTFADSGVLQFVAQSSPILPFYGDREIPY